MPSVRCRFRCFRSSCRRHDWSIYLELRHLNIRDQIVACASFECIMLERQSFTGLRNVHVTKQQFSLAR